MNLAPSQASADAHLGLLPQALLDTEIAHLPVDPASAGALASAMVRTVGDALRHADAFRDGGALAEHRARLRTALGEILQGALTSLSATTVPDLATLRTRLQAPLDDGERALLAKVVGLGAPTCTALEIARQLGIGLAECEDRLEQLRTHLADGAHPLVERMHQELTRELTASDGVLLPKHAATGTLLGLFAGGDDPTSGLHLAAFLFPHEVHMHRGVLFGVSPRRFRQLLRMLPRAVGPHRLPLRVDTLLAELAGSDLELPRGVLLHVLRTEAHVAIELDESLGEIAVADPRSAEARLVELLQEIGKPVACSELHYAWRERYRTTSRRRIDRTLRHSPEFVQCGKDIWALRLWLGRQLQAVAPLVDKAARALCATGGRQHVASLLGSDGADERTVWLVLDRLAADPRVRLLGRGDACAATHQQSRALERLLQDFRRAGGDVVLGRFLANQPPEHRRLVERLLRNNRLFVQPGKDRIDVLSNYPFNQERLRRLLTIVQEQLRQRAGYATATALKAVIDCTDLGGGWLQPELLADVLRRHGPFEVLPNGIVARADLGLANAVRASVRQALREARTALTVDDVLRARPDLGAFAGCLLELLADDPLVHCGNGTHLLLA